MKLLRRPATAIVAAAGLVGLIAGCGARVSPYFGAAAATPGTTNSAGSSATTAPSSGVGPQSIGSTTSLPGQTPTATTVLPNGQHVSTGVTAPGTGSTTTVPVVAPQVLSPQNFNFDPQAEASYCTGSTGNTSSAPGVTPSSITAGAVVGITGLLPGSFDPSYQAVRAAFDAVNTYGGICGRKLNLTVENDNQDSSTNAAEISSLIPNVFAFVGSLSDTDNGGVPAMVAAGIPDIGPVINTNRSNSPVYWSATGGSVYVHDGKAYINNNWINGLRAYHDLPNSVAVLAYSISISQQAGDEYAALFRDAGVKICYTQTGISAETVAEQMPGIVSAMQSDGCGGVITAMDVDGNAAMLDDMSTDNWHPGLVATTYEGYSPTQIAVAGGSQSQGLQVFLSSVPVTENNPGVQLYLNELNTYEPGDVPSEFGLEAWEDAEMYIYGLIKAGHNPTRASLTNVFEGINNWTGDGAFGAYTPRDRTGGNCVMEVEVTGTAASLDSFTRLWPPQGLYCTGQLVQVPTQ